MGKAVQDNILSLILFWRIVRPLPLPIFPSTALPPRGQGIDTRDSCATHEPNINSYSANHRQICSYEATTIKLQSRLKNTNLIKNLLTWELLQYPNDCAVASVVISLKCVRCFAHRHIDYISAFEYTVNVTIYSYLQYCVNSPTATVSNPQNFFQAGGLVLRSWSNRTPQ